MAIRIEFHLRITGHRGPDQYLIVAGMMLPVSALSYGNTVNSPVILSSHDYVSSGVPAAADNA